MKSKLFSVIYWNLLTFSFIFLISACTKFTLPAVVNAPSNTTYTRIEPTKTIPIVDSRLSNKLTAAVVTNTGIVISNDDKVINVWDFKNMKLLNSFNFPTTISKMVLSKNDSLLYVNGSTSTIQVFDWRTGKLIQSMDGTGSVKSMRLSSDNNYLITIDGNNGTLTNVTIFDLKTAEKIYSLSMPINNPDTYDCSISKNAQYFALSGYDFLKVWDRNSNSIVADFSNSIISYSQMDFSPDGTKLIVKIHDNKKQFFGVELLDFLNKREIARISDPSNTSSLSVSQDGSYCYTGFAFIDLQKLSTLWSIDGAAQTNFASFLSSSGNYAIQYDTNGGINLYDNKGNPVSRDPNVLNGWASTSTSFNNQLYILGGTQLLAIPQLGGTNTLYTSPKYQPFIQNIVCTSNTIVAKYCGDVYFWNLSTNSFTNQILTYEPNKNGGYCNLNLAISNDKKMIAVQELNNLSNLLIFSTVDGSIIQTISGLTNATDENVIFFNDNKSIIGTSDNNSIINTWDIISGKLIASFKNIQYSPDIPSLLALTPDTKILVVFNNQFLTFYDYARGSIISNMWFDIIPDNVSYSSNSFHMKMSTDGKYLAVSAINSLRVFDMTSILSNPSVRTYTTKYPIIGLEFDNSNTQLSVVSLREVSNFKL